MSSNGHAPKGRVVAPLETYTFPTGITVSIRPVSEFTKAHMEMAARRQDPPPDPPRNAPESAAAKIGEEFNEADPDYEATLQRYNAKIAMRVMDGTIELAVEVDVDEDELNRIKRTMELVGTPLEEISDKVAYVKHCLVTDVQRDITGLITAIQDITGPKEATVQAATDMFQGDIPGTGRIQIQSEAIGDTV